MDVNDNVVVSPLLILGRTRDRTGENHASAFSPLKITPESQEQESVLVQRELTKFVALWTDVLQVAKLGPRQLDTRPSV
jgi:hypothetical protein